MAEHGLAIIKDLAAAHPGRPVEVLTHCNAGWLAAVDWGTATAPIYAAHEAGTDVHLFVDESGWVLRQQQALDGPHAFELIFEARRENFSRPSTEAMLEDVGLTPEDVKDIIGRVERDNGGT